MADFSVRVRLIAKGSQRDRDALFSPAVLSFFLKILFYQFASLTIIINSLPTEFFFLATITRYVSMTHENRKYAKFPNLNVSSLKKTKQKSHMMFTVACGISGASRRLI